MTFFDSDRYHHLSYILKKNARQVTVLSARRDARVGRPGEPPDAPGG